MTTFDQTFHGNKIYVDLTLICVVLENNFHLWINKDNQTWLGTRSTLQDLELHPIDETDKAEEQQ